jgi:eukaryotic translation initiation factor 2-alpha kinase 4
MVPPPSPWNRSKYDPANQASYPLPGETSRPGVRPPLPKTQSGGSVDYSQAQKEEIEALRAIYMEDFQDADVRGAWSVSISSIVLLRNSQNSISTRKSLLEE